MSLSRNLAVGPKKWPYVFLMVTMMKIMVDIMANHCVLGTLFWISSGPKFKRGKTKTDHPQKKMLQHGTAFRSMEEMS